MRGRAPLTELSYNNKTISPHRPGPMYSVNRKPHPHTPVLDTGLQTDAISTIRYALTLRGFSPAAKGGVQGYSTCNAPQKGRIGGDF